MGILFLNLFEAAMRDAEAPPPLNPQPVQSDFQNICWFRSQKKSPSLDFGVTI